MTSYPTHIDKKADGSDAAERRATTSDFTLSEERRATLRVLELAATLGHFDVRLESLKSEVSILEEAASKVSGLVPFTSMAFFIVDEQSFAFSLAWCSSAQLEDVFRQEIAALVEDRTFAWALGRNRPAEMISEKVSPSSRMLLHPLSAASGPLGMFVGILEEDSVHVADIGYYLLTVVLFSSATLIENYRLYQQLAGVNAELERKVEKRTHALEQSNTQLRSTLKEKEIYRQRLEAVFASMQDAIVSVDLDKVILSLNSAAESLLGAPEVKLVGLPFTEQTLGCLDSCLQVIDHTLQTGQHVKELRTTCSRRGADKVVTLSCSPLMAENGEFSGAVLLVRDITRLASLERQLKERHSFQNIIGRNKQMLKLYELLENLAELDTTVLVTGESGTGKELVADALHYNGARANGPLIKVNCTALSESLLESELFGHVRGAFTGAVSDKPGRFEAAEGGTIFLDEIGDVSLRIQVLLLRFLESKEFERVGDTATRRADVRIVAATNADLEYKVKNGTFRADLYYRLNVMRVQLPPLRERRDDIPLLAEHFIKECNKLLGTTVEGLSDQVMGCFVRHMWDGNVREFKHAIEHACILCRTGIIGLEHLSEEFIILQSAPLEYLGGGEIQPPFGDAGASLHGGVWEHDAPSADTFAQDEMPFRANGYGADAFRHLQGGSEYMGNGQRSPYGGMSTEVKPSSRSLTADQIVHAIEQCGGNKAQAARMLGIGRATLYRKIQEMGI